MTSDLRSRTISRRHFAHGAAAGAALILLPSQAIRAAPATPAPSSLGYPALTVTTADAGFAGVPATIAAGRYLVTLHNTGHQDNAVHLVQPPFGTTLTAFIAQVHAMIAAAFPATPPPGTPPADQGGGPPPFFNQMHWFGGVDDTAPGRRAQAIVDLTPGEYGLFNPNYAGTPADVFARLTVTARTGATAATAPPADAAITEEEFSYGGIPAQVAPGRHIWKVTNIGTTPHELYVAKAPEGTTLAAVIQANSAPGTPPPGGLDLSQVVSVGGVGGLSPGQTGWAVLDLTPGTYVAFCYFPDPKTGMPHAAMGMDAVFTVTG